MVLPEPTPSFIHLNGVFGKFEVPNSKYVIKYFSTLANNREDGSDYHKLLKELKPMRERTDPNKIDDLGSLLQRDLSDFRVSKELIPYLLNLVKGEPDEKHIAFFPAVLCVLMPKGFINKAENAEYPTPTQLDSTSNTITYKREWEYNIFPDNAGNPTNLGSLKINLEKTHIVVLDGQHRANAFRIVAKSFDDTGKNSIYNSFYLNVPKIDKFKADLPVTIVWFETQNNSIEIKPDLISRRLFVDVNNSAKNINRSRFVLLNDREPSSILARFFYSYLAFNKHFNPSTFSLLHSGFDFDEDLKSKVAPHIFTLIVPEILAYSFDWLFFGPRRYTELNVSKVGSERTRIITENFEYYFESGSTAKYIETYFDIDENEKKGIKGNTDLNDFENFFTEEFGKHFYKLLNDFPLYKIHFDACQEIENSYNEMKGEWLSPLRQDTWDRLFKGGEGLYYVFNRLGDSSKGRDFANAAKKIEEELTQIRASKVTNNNEIEVNSAFSSCRTVAFQVGYIMAFDKFYRDSTFVNLDDAINAFLIRLGKHSIEDWVHILTKIKIKLLKDVDPKVWPTYQNLIMRLIQDDGEYFDTDQYKLFSPEAIIFENNFLQKCKEFTSVNLRQQLKDTYFHEIPDSDVSKFIAESVEEINSLFSPLSAFQILPLDFGSIAISALRKATLEDEE